jgi:hypothetical protein
MASKARILSIEIKSSGDESEMLFRFGTEELSRKIPSGHSFVRASAILDADGKLTDCELVTQKV